ncbi:MAG: hypothetical protein MK108_03210 [Mariniblastus sp.]|nr:hypothetical protein [Mariniblastus sp.]
MSRKTHHSRPLLFAITGCLFCLAMTCEFRLHGQEVGESPAKGLDQQATELVAPGYQPQVPARINMALLDDTKPDMQRLTPVPCEDTDCNQSTCTDCQQPDQNWKSTVANGPFEDMVEGLAAQLSNPGMSAMQKADILRSAFETVAQQTRMQTRPEFDRTANRSLESRSGPAFGTAQTMEANRGQPYHLVDGNEMENIRRWLEVVYSHQTMLSSQMQHMAMENAALKASLQLMQQQMKMSRMPTENQVDTMLGTTTAGSAYRQRERYEPSGHSRRQEQSGDGDAVMAWNPAQGYHLKPFYPQELSSTSTGNRVIRADYQTQVDREIEALHRQMERLTTQIEDFQARHKRLQPAPDLLEPVYAPEQELKPLHSVPANRPGPYR